MSKIKLPNAKQLKAAAKTHVDAPQVHPGKTAPATPDVPVTGVPHFELDFPARGRRRISTALARSLSGRFRDYRIYVKAQLAFQTGLELADDQVRSVVQLVLKRLGGRQGRRLASLSDTELAALADEIRSHWVAGSTGGRLLLRRAQIRAKAMKGAVARGVSLRAMHTPEGVWVFVHTNSTDPVIVGEAYVRATARGPIPTRPAFPGSANPRWLRDDGTPGGSPPARETLPELRAQPNPIGEDLHGVLETAPGVVIEQLLRAERRRHTPVGAVGFVRFEGESIPARLRRTLGTGIVRITKSGPEPRLTREAATLKYDEKWTIEGFTGRPLDRPGDEDVLDSVTDVFGPGADKQWARLHAFGPGLGDSTPAGLAYGPVELNQLQNHTIEGILNAGRRERGRVPIKVTAYIKHQPVNGKLRPMVRTIDYQFVTDGRTRRVVVGVDETGRVFRDPPTGFRIVETAAIP